MRFSQIVFTEKRTHKRTHYIIISYMIDNQCLVEIRH